MAAIHYVSEALDDETRGARLFRGDILVFEDVAPMHALCARTQELIREAFGDDDPETCQDRLDRDSFVAAARAARARYRKDPEVAALARHVLAATGVALSRTYWDRLILRVLPSGKSHSARRIERLGPHRDSWGSNLMAQVNWWAPIFPIAPERTVALYPNYFDRPIANSSADWDLDELRARQRAIAAGEELTPYPLLPVPTEEIETASELRLSPEPGDLICFSSAHLHASVANETGLARFSTEFRTVNLDDLRAGRGAPNVDGRAPRLGADLFTRTTDGLSLAEEMVGFVVNAPPKSRA
ncbi:MAG: hypothetical protein QNJ94_09425 [Alphaproteobacteria bacterium]|nr:hypothetical protein [Alphaproteobacteria bacterium]